METPGWSHPVKDNPENFLEYRILIPYPLSTLEPTQKNIASNTITALKLDRYDLIQNRLSLLMTFQSLELLILENLQRLEKLKTGTITYNNIQKTIMNTLLSLNVMMDKRQSHIGWLRYTILNSECVKKAALITGYTFT